MNKIIVFGAMAIMTVSLVAVGSLSLSGETTDTKADTAVTPAVDRNAMNIACTRALSSLSRADALGCGCVADEMARLTSEAEYPVAATAVSYVLRRSGNTYDEMNMYHDINALQKAHDMEIDQSIALLASVRDVTTKCVAQPHNFTAGVRDRLAGNIDKQTAAMKVLNLERERNTKPVRIAERSESPRRSSRTRDTTQRRAATPPHPGRAARDSITGQREKLAPRQTVQTED